MPAKLHRASQGLLILCVGVYDIRNLSFLLRFIMELAYFFKVLNPLLPRSCREVTEA